MTPRGRIWPRRSVTYAPRLCGTRCMIRGGWRSTRKSICWSRIYWLHLNDVTPRCANSRGRGRTGLEFDVNKGTCSIDGCERAASTRGYCGAHYHRWQRGTLANARPIAPYGLTACSVPGCDQPHSGRGYCKTHLYRLRANGDPTKVRPPGFRPGEAPTGENSPMWRGGAAPYSSVHHRLQRLHGDAASHACVDCDRPAAHWSYKHGAPDEAIGERGFPYSNDLDWYEPRCVPCHYQYDREICS